MNPAPEPDQRTRTGPPPDPAGEPTLDPSHLPGTASPDSAGPPAWTTRPEGPAGGTLGEFVVIAELGRGAFGRVFLAHQPSLDRRVAVKASWARAMGQGEGVALAGLEHDHIVKVYSEFHDAGTNWHCLCLQYVPGTDLAGVIAHVHKRQADRPASGRAVLAAIDAAGRGQAGFDPAALRDRDALAGDDFAQAVCRLGGRLAEALAFAHARGVLHCDIKPANILVTPYGRPMLADFNVSFDRAKRDPDSGLGGTRAYMAPEYKTAILAETSAAVDERCDVYSLGVVLHELATGVRPKADTPDPLERVPRELAAVIRRCLEVDPARRYQTAGTLAEALGGAWHLLALRRSLPPAGRLGRLVTARPVLALAVAGLIPHFAASVINIGYNSVEIDLTPAQQEAFMMVTVVYNLLFYPACGLVLFLLLRAIACRLPGLPRASGPAVDDLRPRVRHFGWWAILLGAVGWLPGGLIFPLGIDLLAGPIPAAVYAHYLVSFTLSGLVGVVFSYLGVEYVVFRALLPRLGNPDAYAPARMWDEVRPLTAPFGPFLMLASAVPLTGAVLLVALGPDGPMTLGFRVLVAGLIGLGMGGVGVAERLTRRLHRLAAVWEADAGDGPTGGPQLSWDGRRSGTGTRIDTGS